MQKFKVFNVLRSQFKDGKNKSNCLLRHFGVQSIKHVANVDYILSRLLSVGALERRMTAEKNVCEHTDTPNVGVWQGDLFVLDNLGS